ncbi:MAG: hypothetical protein ACM3YF_02920, partial [Candidatus Zixiibacteriota bacterium]
MNICKSCGVTIHEEGKSFCPACEVSAREAHEVGLVGDGPDAEKAEVSLEDTSRMSVLKLSKTPDKAESQEEDTDKVKTESTEEPVKAPEVPTAVPPAVDDDRLSFSESPFSAGYGSEEIPKESPVETPKEELKGEPETLSAAIEQSGPKSYLSAEERQALLSDLSAARKAAGGAGGAAVKVNPATSSPKPVPKRPEAAMTVRESHSGARLSDKVTLPTAVARGIAYFSGTHIHLVGGAHMASGEELVFKDRIYVLKEKPGTAGGSRWVYVFPMVLLLMAGALLWVI